MYASVRTSHMLADLCYNGRGNLRVNYERLLFFSFHGGDASTVNVNAVSFVGSQSVFFGVFVLPFSFLFWCLFFCC